ncbi:MAG: flippase-like domain-containing protein [Bacteroidaceae bacterium]|nr:flippase-like domain-containing protein [Bacteroidaceae bacterium]
MKLILNILKFSLPFALGIGILWWMYRDTDGAQLAQSLAQINWGWMLLSLAFGVVPLVFRALRWRLALLPLGERPSRRVLTDAIFVSYAASLAVPRIGEVTRCGTLKRFEGVSFSKSLGTVVAERVVDSVLMMLIALAALLSQLPQFLEFLRTTGTSPRQLLERFTSTGYVVTGICLLLILATAVFMLLRVKAFQRGREKMMGFVEGLASLRHLEHLPTYLLYSIGIWAAYFLHFYLAFFCFDFTSGIPPLAALLIFSASSFAVLVPTPNGAGSWHFAVKTMLVLYGVAEAPAVAFALVVHTIQTALVVAMGAAGWADLNFRIPQPSKQKSL